MIEIAIILAAVYLVGYAWRPHHVERLDPDRAHFSVYNRLPERMA